MDLGGTKQANGVEPFDDAGEALAAPDARGTTPLPAPNPHLVAVSSVPPADERRASTPTEPTLPNAEARAPVPMVSHSPVVGASTWYRTDQQRYKSVYRRANPWYRRLG